jgi:hypothetical protein
LFIFFIQEERWEEPVAPPEESTSTGSTASTSMGILGRPRNDAEMRELLRAGCSRVPQHINTNEAKRLRVTLEKLASAPPPVVPTPFPSGDANVPRVPLDGLKETLQQNVLDSVSLSKITLREGSIFKAKNAADALLWSNHARWQEAVFGLPISGPVLGCTGINIGLIGPSDLRTHGFLGQELGSKTVTGWAPLRTTFIEWTPTMSLHSTVDTGRQLQAKIKVDTTL